MKKVSLFSFGLLILSGCSSIPYSCALGNECVGTDEAYEAAIENRGNSESTLGEPFKKGNKASRTRPGSSQQELLVESEWRPYAGGGLSDQPLYLPPRPVRIWIAPWQAEDGLLRSGQFIYATRKGGWQMGQMRDGGAASGLLQPHTFERSTARGNIQRVQPEQQLIPQPDK